MKTTAALLIPALRADANGRFTRAREQALEAIAQGVGGFVLYGGEQDAVRALTKELQQRTRSPLLIGAEMERGAGQQFAGATGLPPLAALAWLGDAESLKRAARLTAREARTMGVNWDLAPVVDLELAAEPWAVSTRSLGADPSTVARMAADWITACQAEGVLACAKHFPGHGRVPHGATGEAAVARADRDTLHGIDLVPFRAAIDAGVASMMTAHAAFPGLDPGGPAATYSRELLQWLLRQQMRYDNLIVADAVAMRRAMEPNGSEGECAVRAIAAGCDVIVGPADVAAVSDALEAALAERRLDPQRVQQSVRRRLKWAQWAAPPNEWRRPTASDAAWGAQLADRVVHVLRGARPSIAASVSVQTVDARATGEGTSRDAFADTLRTVGCQVSDANATGPIVLTVFPGAAAEHGDDGMLRDVTARASAMYADALAHGRSVVAVLFGHPRLATVLPPDAPMICAWTGDVAMQRAAARWLGASRA